LDDDVSLMLGAHGVGIDTHVVLVERAAGVGCVALIGDEGRLRGEEHLACLSVDGDVVDVVRRQGRVVGRELVDGLEAVGTRRNTPDPPVPTHLRLPPSMAMARTLTSDSR
jgi:hypothetical protein